MLTQLQQEEYLDEIRKQVCSRCVEKPPGGPPCAPLGKNCGVELHLPALIDAIHEVQSPWVESYLEHDRQVICEKCAFLHSSICPCPMDYLLSLILQAVETVDARHEKAEQEVAPPEEAISLENIRRAYHDAVGGWVGCDWPTYLGREGLNLKGWTAAQAYAMAQETLDPRAAAQWKHAADWLAQVERYAKQAEIEAGLAVHAAENGRWPEALEHAERAWAMEFSTGRPLRQGQPFTWLALRQEIEQACARQTAETAAG